MAVRRRRLARRRKSLGFSQESLAERLAVDAKTVRRWESGESEPQPWLWPKLGSVLQLSAQQLDELLTEVDGREESDERIGHTPTHPGDAGPAATDQLRARVRELDVRYDRVPATSLLAQTGQCLGQLSLLRAHATGDRVSRELCAIEADAAILMGQLVWDVSLRRDHAIAYHYFDQAIAAARLVGDPTAEGRALLRKSFVALYGEKNAIKGLILTTRTAEITASTSRVLAGLGMLHAAEAYAMQGNRVDCERSLGGAEDHFGRITPGDAAFELFSPTQPGRLAGSCYLFLNDPRRAEPILADTARQVREHSKSHAIVLGNLALACLRQKEVDAAIAALHEALDTVELTRGGGGLNIVFGACRELRPWREMAAVQELYGRAMALLEA